jgi:hypothetical protein
MLNAVILNVSFCYFYAGRSNGECRHSECHYSEHYYAKRHYTECHCDECHHT